MNKKGGTMVEAALVFPIIILSLMAIIMILMFLFKDAASLAGMHLALRSEAGHQTGTYHGQPGSSSILVSPGILGIHGVINGKSFVSFNETGLLNGSFQKPLTGHIFLTDERKYARYMDFFNLQELQNGDQSKKTNQ
jgi:hypothetical protein